MNNEDKAEFAQYWNATIQSKGQKPLTMTAIAMCFDDLLMYDIEIVKGALKRFRQNPDEGQYHLQVSAIIKIIEGDSKSAANKAWQTVQKIAISCGGHDDIVINDIISMACIDELGGLQRLCDRPTEFDLSDHGRAFKNLYEHYRINGFGHDQTPRVLRGSGYAERQRFGLPELKPRMIGFDGPSHNAVSQAIPDMSKPRYEQIENSTPVSAEQARENLKALFGLVHTVGVESK